MLLADRNAVIYGGGGAIGSAVARAFAREGARVHLVGRTRARLDRVADEIRAAGGAAETAVLDALDEAAVDRHADMVAERFGGIDISFDLISFGDVHGTPLAEMSPELFERPVVNAVRSLFLTARAAARHMVPAGSGVILTFGGDGGREPIRDYFIGGFQVALEAMGTLRRQLAAELGPHGIRVVTLHTGGIPDTIPAAEPGREAITAMIVRKTMLGRAATLDDVGNVAAFLASDRAASITAASVNMTCGAVAD
ncbi:SDR family NAD(P)-dependent oxidoreductase [Kitasatospora sp. NPDC059571]|uniref:SDR family NAD(P)-dependent oxidoreductase n=1 Tax=Kitasatospora sp. NPDC059571 TaxID=3346871 RepID=UPI0036932876